MEAHYCQGVSVFLGEWVGGHSVSENFQSEGFFGSVVNSFLRKILLLRVRVSNQAILKLIYKVKQSLPSLHSLLL